MHCPQYMHPLAPKVTCLGSTVLRPLSTAFNTDILVSFAHVNAQAVHPIHFFLFICIILSSWTLLTFFSFHISLHIIISYNYIYFFLKFIITLYKAYGKIINKSYYCIFSLKTKYPLSVHIVRYFVNYVIISTVQTLV